MIPTSNLNSVVLPTSPRMSASEMRASLSLASIYGLRMLGMFLILPVFAIYASTMPSQPSSSMIGWALGAYGLTQAIFQLPFGMASDKFGRKKVIYLGLIIFAVGSFVAAYATTIEIIIVGRAIQGAGAVSAAVTALVADLTSDEHRTKAMAMIGGTIGVTFALSLIAGPALNHWIGVPGIFLMTGVLTILAIFVVKFVVPNPAVSSFHSDAEASKANLKEVLRNTQLLRLNFGIFALHAAQMALFIVVPFALKDIPGWDVNQHWKIYLPVLIISFVLMVPAIIYAEKRAKMKQVFVSAIAIMVLAQLLFASFIHSFWGIVFSLTAYFVAFNTLEASLPSIISKIAPAATKGTAIGVYNTCQSLGVFVGGVVGGYLAHHYSNSAVFIFCSVLMGMWLLFALSMQAPMAVKTKMYHIQDKTLLDALLASEAKTRELADKLLSVVGVCEAAVFASEAKIVIKIDNQREWNDQLVQQLIGG